MALYCVPLPARGVVDPVSCLTIHTTDGREPTGSQDIVATVAGKPKFHMMWCPPEQLPDWNREQCQQARAIDGVPSEITRWAKGCCVEITVEGDGFEHFCRSYIRHGNCSLPE